MCLVLESVTSELIEIYINGEIFWILTEPIVLPGISIAVAHDECIDPLPLFEESLLEITIIADVAKVLALQVCACQSPIP